MASSTSYRGNGFTIDQPAEWEDATLHVLNGPTLDGHQHAITIQTHPRPDAETLQDFAAPLVETAGRSLRQASVLLSDTITLHEPTSTHDPEVSPPDAPSPEDRPCYSSPRTRFPLQAPPSAVQRAPGTPEALRAHRVILRWHPKNADQPYYQEQLFLLTQGKGYVLSATFTQESRRHLGARIERIMRSFCPSLPASKRPA